MSKIASTIRKKWSPNNRQGGILANKTLGRNIRLTLSANCLFTLDNHLGSLGTITKTLYLLGWQFI